MVSHEIFRFGLSLDLMVSSLDVWMIQRCEVGKEFLLNEVVVNLMHLQTSADDLVNQVRSTTPACGPD